MRWRTNLAHIGRVWYGSAPGALTSFVNETASVTDHEVRLTGLAPNTRYYYGVGTDGGLLAGGDAKSFFTTSPAVGRAKNTRIWAFGDAGRGSESQFATRDAYYG